MEEYRKIVFKRMIIIGIFSVLFIILVGLHWGLRSQAAAEVIHVYEFIRGTQFSLFCVMTGLLLKSLYTYQRGLKDEERLREIYIKEHDEREREIYNRVGVNSFWISLCVLLAATVIAGFYNAVVFTTLGAVVIGEAAIGCICKIYIRSKL